MGQAEINNDDESLIQEFLEEAREQCGRAEAILLSLSEGKIEKSQMDELFRFAHTLKGSGMAVGIAHLPDFVHQWEDFLARTRERGTPIYLPDEVVTLFLDCNDTVREFIGSYPGEGIDWPRQLGELARRLRALVDFNPVSRKASPSEYLDPQHASNDDREIHKDAVASNPKLADGTRSRHLSIEETVRVKLSRIDALIQKVGELSVQQEIVTGKTLDLDRAPETESLLRKLNQLCSESHDIAMSLRMVPIRPMMQTLRRTLRDVSLKLNKSVRFVSEGESAELDVNLVHVLNEALMHIVRNSVDHGIESSQERLALGKPNTATVRVVVRQRGGNIVIDVSDDGKGIDPQKIRRKAIERGLLQENDACSDAELFEFVFRPGFSTSENVTEYSGRGVGLDVVSSNIRALDGQVILRSELGKGTLFTIVMPLSVAVVDVMRVDLGGDAYLIPLHNIQETVAVSRSSVQRAAAGAKMINLRGSAIPVYDLGRIFHSDHDFDISGEGRGSAILTHWHEHFLAFIVDDIIGRQQVVIKPLGQELSHVQGLSGSAVLGDGSVGLIVDLPSLVRSRGLARE